LNAYSEESHLEDQNECFDEDDLEYSFSKNFTYEYQLFEDNKKNKSKFILKIDFVYSIND